MTFMDDQNRHELEYSTLLRRLRKVRNQEKQLALIAGLVQFSAWVLFICLIVMSAECFFHFNRHGRIIIDIFMIAVLSVLFLYYLGITLFSILFRSNFPTYDTLAERIGKKFPKIKDRLVNALQLYRNAATQKRYYSLQLILQALDQTHALSVSLDFSEIINRGQFKKKILAGLSGFVVMILVLLAFRNPLTEAGFLLLHPNRHFQVELPFTISIQPGDVQVIKYENVDIHINGDGNVPEKMQLHILKVHAGTESVIDLFNKRNQFFYTLERLTDTTHYYLTGPQFISDVYHIQVVELPMVRQLQVELDFPTYSRLEPLRMDDNVGDIHALKGTKARFRIEANKQLSRAVIDFDSTKDLSMAIRGHVARGTIKIDKDEHYRIRLLDRENRSNQNPIEYRIQVMNDDYPIIRIVEPGEDVDITESMQLPLTIEAEDDFGFSGIYLSYRMVKSATVTDTTWRTKNIPTGSLLEPKINVEFNWDLTELDLYPEDVLAYYVEVLDNDDISGPKKAQSFTFHVRFPSIDEMFADVEREQELAYESVENAYEQSKELREQLAKISQEMKKNAQLNWEDKKQLEDIVNTQKEIEQTLEEVQQTLDKMIERMEKNDLISVETLKKYMELQNLMQEMMTEELQQAMEQLQQAMQKIDPELMKQAVENLNISQEEFLQQIDKTLSLLKRLRVEQRLDELAKRLESMIEQQNEINEMAAKNEAKMKDKLSADQQHVAQDADAMKEQLSELQKKMEEFPDMPAEQIKATEQIMQEQLLQQNMQSAVQKFQQNNMQQGMQFGKKAQQTMSNMMASLQQAKQQMLSMQMQELMTEMKRINHNLLYLSKQQESVMKKGKNLSGNSPTMQKLAEKQMDLMSSMERVIERAGSMEKKSFFMSPDIQKAIGKSLVAMKNAIANIEARNMPRVTRSQGQSMAAINDAIKRVRQAMQQLSSAQSSSGMEQLMQQLSQMAQQQQGINQQTMQLGMGQMTMQQQAAMARLAAQQAALRKSMEQLAREYGNRSDVLGNLDQIAKDMKAVAKDLKSKQVTRQTYNRQRRILSRLLDAQKSMQRREYSRKRKAETGKFYIAKSPGALPEDMGEKDLLFRQDILNAKREGYTRDYQELIRKYFEALMHEDKSGNN